MEKIKHTLQVDEDLPLFQKGWKVHIAAWVFFYLLVLMAAAGLFGHGPISKQTSGSKGAGIEYEYFLTASSETEMILRVDDTKDTMQIAFPQEYLERMEIVRFTPMPQSSVQRDGNIVYTFPGQDASVIYVRAKAKKAGALNSYAWVNNNKVPLSHFIYP